LNNLNLRNTIKNPFTTENSSFRNTQITHSARNKNGNNISPRALSTCVSANDNNDLRSTNSNFSINQAEIGLKKSFKENKEKFLNRIRKGPPETFRWVSWIIALELDDNRTEASYIDLLNIDLEKKTDTQIKKDLNRTINNDKIVVLDKTFSSLYNVLKAYANFDKDVGYCQGMNFISAFLLIISDFNEVDTFYLMTLIFTNKICDNLGIRGFFLPDFPLLKLYLLQFNHIFEKKLPKLKNLFEELGVPDELWIAKWIQSLYTICLPLDYLVRVWDCLISTGHTFLFKFAIALLAKFEKDLLKFDDISDVNDFLKKINNENQNQIEIDIELLINEACNVKINLEELNAIKENYEKENGNDINTCRFTVEGNYFRTYTKETVIISDFEFSKKLKNIKEKLGKNKFIKEDIEEDYLNENKLGDYSPSVGCDDEDCENVNEIEMLDSKIKKKNR